MRRKLSLVVLAIMMFVVGGLVFEASAQDQNRSNNMRGNDRQTNGRHHRHRRHHRHHKHRHNNR